MSETYDPMTTCHCGRPLHYTDPLIQQTVERVIRTTGDPFVTVIVGTRAWRVQRHFLALHGLKGADVEALGFREVVAGVSGDLDHPRRYGGVDGGDT